MQASTVLATFCASYSMHATEIEMLVYSYAAVSPPFHFIHVLYSHYYSM